MAPSKPAVDFNAIVQADRRRRKNEIAAQKIFGKARRRSTSGVVPNNRRSGAVPSLASRIGPVGVTRRSVSTSNRPRRAVSDARAGKGRTEWTHNFHESNNSYASDFHMTPRGPKVLRSNPNSTDTRMALSPGLHNQFNIVGNAKPVGSLSIRGLASPYTVMVENLASGTTAADIESAMTPVGGVILSCRLVSEQPRVIAELIFEAKEGAENVVETFNNQSADGNILHVYHKLRSIPSIKHSSTAASGQPVTYGPRSDIIADRSDDSRSYGYGGSELCTPRGPSRDRYREYERDEVVDGSYGFDDGMEIDVHQNRSRGMGLYSDNIIGGNYGRGIRGDRSRGYR